ncbi:MAG TPA: NAD(P)H-dependent glycerol-3-phosphate dehydrogenase [Chitinophagaceae bacterium]|nr:NAD(P)H-dependent glycerol-3-phosphate dehydrogenase [Chitinophagaceae bacterium]
MQLGILGGGSFATALAKLLTDNGNTINWYVRNKQTVDHIFNRHHNPNYLSSVYFDTQKLLLSSNIEETIQQSECIVLAIPSMYIHDSLKSLSKEVFKEKKIVSAVKGIMPEHILLVNDYLNQQFNVPLENYYCIMGPCHAEEVAAEKLSYLTFSGVDENLTQQIACRFKTDYLNTIINDDIYGVQFAAILKNIYALAAGIAHGLEYGDNFLSVLIANAADEMAGFLRKVGVRNMEVGIHHEIIPGVQTVFPLKKSANYAASVYLGDLLVTCYSLFSRNRTFGNMIGKGYSVKSAQLELNMVAEGYNASRCIYIINEKVNAEMTIAETVYKILWENLNPRYGFKRIEETLI